MEERNNVTTIIKSEDPEKLAVFHAESLQDQIRFYLNDTKYLAAVECNGGCLVMVAEEVAKGGNEKSKISIIKENLKEFIKIISVSTGIFALCFAVIVYLSKILSNTIVFLYIMNMIYVIGGVINVVISEMMETAPCLKSKHSAEHMMVNFLESNKRLPKSIEEVKKSSRFSPKCGSRKRIKGITEEFVRSITATFLTGIVSEIVECLFHNTTVTSIVLIVTYFFLRYVIGKLITKYRKLNFIISRIEKVLTNVVQCANTTTKVKNKDIILAYFAAKPWMQIVYPEFYNEEEDVFWKQYSKS